MVENNPEGADGSESACDICRRKLTDYEQAPLTCGHRSCDSCVRYVDGWAVCCNCFNKEYPEGL